MGTSGSSDFSEENSPRGRGGEKERQMEGEKEVEREGEGGEG